MATLPNLSISSIAAVAGFALISTLVLTLIKRYNALRHIPGPFIASITDLWIASRLWRGEHYVDIMAGLHAKYGPVVRSGPYRVSFASADAIPEIYGVSQANPKAASYDPMIVLANGQEIPTIITLRDEKRVTEIKRHISAGFSQSTWLKQEDQIDETIKLLLTQLRKRTGTAISLKLWLKLWTFDTLTTLAFSETRGFLEAGADIDNVFPSSHRRFAHWREWALAPRLEALIFKNILMQKLQTTSSALAQLAMRHIQERKAVDKSATGRDLLGLYVAASQAAPETIGPRDVVSLTISTIHAGSDSVALVSSTALARALTNCSTYAKLEKEILEAGLKRLPAAFADVEQLPYLDALIRETLRYSVNPNINARTIISPAGATICGFHIPCGTDVAISEYNVTRDPVVFGSDAEIFRPERWLEVDEQTRRDMDRAGMGFSWGRRVCVGQHLARIEMKKVISTLVSEFQIEPINIGERDWDGNFKGPDLDVRLTPRAK